jgi:hypothetical protein
MRRRLDRGLHAAGLPQLMETPAALRELLRGRAAASARALA